MPPRVHEALRQKLINRARPFLPGFGFCFLSASPLYAGDSGGIDHGIYFLSEGPGIRRVMYNGSHPGVYRHRLKMRLLSSQNSKQITKLLSGWGRGDLDALNLLTPVVYDELHRIAHRYMRRERPGHTLQTSALINEAYIRLIDRRGAQWQNRAHFFAIASKMMRRILVDQARGKGYVKRGGNPVRVSLDEGMVVSGKDTRDLVALDDALKDLETMDPRKSSVVEMRFFGGLSLEETAEALSISIPTVEREWRAARAWLHKAMTSGHDYGS